MFTFTVHNKEGDTCHNLANLSPYKPYIKLFPRMFFMIKH